MRAIKVSGYGDYEAMQFEQFFEGKTVKDLIDDFEITKESFFAGVEYAEGEITIIEVESKASFCQAKEIYGDYDFMKGKNVFFEDETL